MSLGVLAFVTRFRVGAVMLFFVIFLVCYAIGVPRYIEVNHVPGDVAWRLQVVTLVFEFSFLTGALFAKVVPLWRSASDCFYRLFVRYPEKISDVLTLRLCCVSIFAFAVGCYYFRYGIPLVASQPDKARFLAAAGATPFLFVFSYLAPLSLVLAGTRFGRKGQALALLVGIALSVLTAFRSAPARLIVAGMISFDDQSKLNIVPKFLAGTCIVLVFIALTAAKFSFMTPLELWDAIVDRLFLVNIRATEFVVGHFPESDSFGLGRILWMDASSYIPNGEPKFGEWVNGEIFAYENVSSNPSYTVLWADWGYLLVVPTAFLGWALQLFDRIPVTRKLNRAENVNWSFLMVTLAFVGTGPYAKTLYYVLPMLMFMYATRLFVIRKL